MHRRGASCIIGVYFWSQGWKAFKSMLLAIILTISGAKARKSSNRCSWLSSCRLLEPRPKSLEINAPGYHFVDFWSQGQKVFNRCSWLSFCRLLEPRPESLQIDAPGYHVDDFKAVFALHTEHFARTIQYMQYIQYLQYIHDTQNIQYIQYIHDTPVLLGPGCCDAFAFFARRE